MSKNYQNFMKRAGRTLSERADGFKMREHRNPVNRADGANSETVIIQNADPDVQAGLDNFFQFTVTNNTASPVNTALVPANYDTERYVIDDGAVVKTYDNIEDLRAAGHMVGAVVADGEADYTTSDGVKVDMACQANDPTKPIKDFLRYIKFNPVYLKHMDIISSNINSWSGSMAITFCNPFFDNKVQRVNLTTFFSRFQYQNDRIGINFDPNKLEFSDRLLLTTTIPANSSMQFIYTF